MLNVTMIISKLYEKKSINAIHVYTSLTQKQHSHKAGELSESLKIGEATMLIIRDF